MALVGYARVSTVEGRQLLDRQRRPAIPRKPQRPHAL